MKHLLYLGTFLGFDIEVYFIWLIFGIPIFFLIRLFLKFRMVNKTKRIILTWLITIIATPLLYATFVFAVCYAQWYYPKNEFDSKEWITNPDQRYELSDDLINRKMLIGKSKAEVRRLLGGDGNNSGNNKSDDWYYTLGFKPSAIDPSSLDVVFKDGKVTAVEANYHD